MDAKKEVMNIDHVWDFLKSSKIVYVASGKKVLEYVPGTDNRDELVKKATGRTGNLRAPTVKKGNKLYVGFNQKMYEGILG